MPLTSVKYEDMVPLFEQSLECMVTITRIEEISKVKNRNGGFIIHCTDNFTVIAVHSSVEFEAQKIVVKFSNGTESADTHLIKLSGPINLVAVKIPRGDWKKIKYGEIKNSSEVVFSIVSLFQKMLPFISRIISPRCTCVNASGDEIVGTRETFSFNLPIGGEMGTKVTPRHYETTMEFTSRILGAPVFNTDGHFVGFLDRCGISFDFKYGLRSEYVRILLDNWLAKREWKVAIQYEIQKSTRDPKRLKRN